MTNELKESEIFRKAAKVVNHGWTQGCEARDAMGAEIHPFPGRPFDAATFCSIGALHFVVVADNPMLYYARSQPIYNILHSAIQRLTSFASAGDWNDSPEQTQKEVVKMLKRIARELEAEGR